MPENFPEFFVKFLCLIFNFLQKPSAAHVPADLGGPKGGSCLVLDADSGAVHYFSESYTDRPVWDPSGTKLAFFCDEMVNEEGMNWKRAIWIVDAESGAVSILACDQKFNHPNYSHPFHLYMLGLSLAWNSSGTKLAYGVLSDAHAEHGQPSLRLVNVDDGAVEQEVELPAPHRRRNIIRQMDWNT